MALSAQDIIDQGYAKSAAARVESIATPDELVTRIGQCLRELFLLLARENPLVLGTSAVMNFDGTGWPRAADCLRAIRVAATAGTIVNPALAVGAVLVIVPYDDQGFAGGKAALTELGQRYVPTGQAADPTGGSLQLIYARAPYVPTQTTDPIDALFPEFFSDTLAYDIAAYLAAKDARENDRQMFLAFKSADVQQMLQWSRGQTYEIVQRFPLINPPLTNSNGGKQTPAEQ